MKKEEKTKEDSGSDPRTRQPSMRLIVGMVAVGVAGTLPVDLLWFGESEAVAVVGSILTIAITLGLVVAAIFATRGGDSSQATDEAASGAVRVAAEAWRDDVQHEQESTTRTDLDTCFNCGHKMTTRREDVPCLGLPGTMLFGVSVSRCPNCGEYEVEIPMLHELNRGLALEVTGRIEATGAREVERPRSLIPTCAQCEKRPAVCFGYYEGGEPDRGPLPACDRCCGHGCEDGWCVPIADLPGWAATVDLNARRITEERDALRGAIAAAYRHGHDCGAASRNMALRGAAECYGYEPSVLRAQEKP